MSFAEHGIDTRRSSGHERTTCPQCGPQRKKRNEKSLSVDHDLGVWMCHHCGWSGGIAKRTKGMSSKVVYAKPDAPVAQASDDAFEKWFADRGISMDVVNRNRVFKTTAWMPQANGRAGVIAFPYYRDGQLINIKYRTRDKGFRMESGCERVLYGLDDIKGADRVIIVEGEMDKLAIEMCGYTAVVSVPDGAPSSASQNFGSKFDYLNDERLQEVKEWVIAVDSDAPGMVLKEELIRRLGAEKCRVVTWDADCKDANDVLLKWGKDVLVARIESAVAVPVEGIFEGHEVAAELMDMYENGIESGLSTGWPDLDEYITVMPGQLNIVTGIPGHGKSEWLDAMCVNFAVNHGWRTAMFSPENYPSRLHVAKLMEKYVGKPFNPGPTQRMSKAEAEYAMEWVSEHFCWLYPKSPTLDEILAKAKVAVTKRGIRVLVIDPWNEVETSKPDGMSETEYISVSLSRLRRFARHHNVAVFVVAHPRIMQKDTSGKYPPPTPYDISGSANWRNKADNCFCVHRDLTVQGGDVEIYVQKVKFKICGKVGMVKLKYDYVTGIYHDSRPRPAPMAVRQMASGKTEAF